MIVTVRGSHLGSPWLVGVIGQWCAVDVSYAAPQANIIVNVALHREYSTGIVFIFSEGRISIMSKTNIENNSNKYY
jgi:hypothetical protein